MTQTVSHSGTNRVWRSATTLIEANALPLSQILLTYWFIATRLRSMQQGYAKFRLPVTVESAMYFTRNSTESIWINYNCEITQLYCLACSRRFVETLCSTVDSTDGCYVIRLRATMGRVVRRNVPTALFGVWRLGTQFRSQCREELEDYWTVFLQLETLSCCQPTIPLYYHQERSQSFYQLTPSCTSNFLVRRPKNISATTSHYFVRTT